ncbi:MAG: chorismate-binding protein, partial [Gaiellaceae bacterium]
MLQLWHAEGALAALEEYLRDAGFFGGGADGIVADVFLGYGLSQTLRRRPEPPPDEPCPLPLAACRIRAVTERLESPGPCSFGEWRRSWTDAEYVEAVEAVRAAIARGDVYQVNLVQHLSAPFAGDPGALAERLAPLAPLAPRPLAGADWTIVSASPELFL